MQPPDDTVEGRWIFKNEDRHETPFTVKDKAGKRLVEVAGVCTRLH